MDITVAGMRVLREVAERGTFTAAARALGYTQSAVSRQVAALEQATGARLFDRHPGGVRLTGAGRALLRHAVVALDALDAADRELRGAGAETGRVRLGCFPTAGAVVVARALATLRRDHPRLQVTTREATTPQLVRALRAGTIDLALLSSRPPHRSPDTDDPPLHVEPLVETHLAVAVAADGTFAGRTRVAVEEIVGEPWIAGPAGADEPLLGVWPGLPGRPKVHHTARDWLTKLHLVAAGAGITTAPPVLLPAVPPGIHFVEVDGVAEEIRRVNLVRLPGPLPGPSQALVHALRHQAAALADGPG
ncbi:LysR family transcriptional regulator [Streptantibioticus cattleyicolor]|uniref:LysR family transcriptional regulator n=1 Tax=Streptantibioticus cattleyicolor (strain ATCC 35852 / DSM 46488 / JCM 4925 / NBRC 14057 / NRRL 8057) TaxID=1003195 RepID=F8JM91_STREN|nr:LysR family transcriptional regulator [Streptantibioticus cattleyicolor]AEW99571.1 LysR family transcriptional regulator [Streptantibioticus cattleyicolor NRRL 8057 = DSM 46488]CCB71390.1 putative LysR-family transcriptional regulator [Streptantibioticus cattleyicolor NRRL 8057 = DSM 46488]